MKKPSPKKNSKSSAKQQQTEVESIIRRHGTDARFVKFEMHVTAGELTEFFGKRCEDFEPLCLCCQNWVLWNRTGRAEFTLDRERLVKLLRDEENDLSRILARLPISKT